MKKTLYSILGMVLAGAVYTGCTDEVSFGSSFIDKAPGGTMNMDSIFANPDYVNQFLTQIYTKQYYGLPYKHDAKNGNSADHYVGKLDALTDLYQMHWSACRVWSQYYTGTLSANDTPLISFAGTGLTSDHVWETVHDACLIKENIDRVPNMTEKQKKYIVAQATALQAFAYSVLLPHYGGLPLIDRTLTSVDGGVGERATFEETVNFIVDLCDQAKDDLYWSYSGNDSETNSLQTGRWTKAGVMALKAQVLWIAASPLFNADQGYFGGQSEAEQKHLVWYGDFKQERWTRAKTAFEEFWRENEANGNYWHLEQPAKKTHEGYRIAYRRGYINDDSRENIHWTKVADYYGTQSTYAWLLWNGFEVNGNVNRNNMSPTVEYIEMFPDNTGKLLSREKDFKYVRTYTVGEGNDAESFDVYTCLNGSGNSANDKLFYKYTAVRGGFKKEASRDPRLYENARVSGTPSTLDFNKVDGTTSGNIQELWVGGQEAGNCVKDANSNKVTETQTTYCPTGFARYKYVLSASEYWRDKDMHWNVLTIPDMILMYAEVLAECNKLGAAIEQVDLVRARVGLKSINSSYNSSLHLTSNKENLIEEILRERACELGMTNARYIDMVRRKRTDWMTKQLHGMATYRMIKNSKNEWIRRNAPWFGNDKDSGMAEPSRFEYEFFELRTGARVLWGMDPQSPEVKKWLMMPLPQNEINKGYGLIQNPGW
ncbi:MAG: RagB/SusD family nutrient uptake outer membrane protein [Clostridiales bacterium]|nr:RagB/SusD family nutrient uptake outer membrane protein [Clostridiales bacterium]